jgi:hypothetical protein
MGRTFDRPTLDLLDRAREVAIETLRLDGTPRRTTIWLMVDRNDVFVRSWKGDRGYWYQSARETPDQVTLHVGRRAIPVRVISATDVDSVGRCSLALEAKYAGDPATRAMVSPAVLGTTLRVEPR